MENTATETVIHTQEVEEQENWLVDLRDKIIENTVKGYGGDLYKSYHVPDGARFETIQEARVYLLEAALKKFWQDTINFNRANPPEKLGSKLHSIFIKTSTENLNAILKELESYESAGDQWPVA